jgi:FkbM family methyltransferase
VKKILFVLARFTGNNFSQKVLLQIVKVSNYLMGIGSGGDIRYSGESISIEMLKENFNPPYTVFDVGGNQGQFISLLNAYMNLDNNIIIHSFEPSKFTYNILFELYGLKDTITLNNFGLGDKCEIRDLYYPFEGTGYASLSKRNIDHLGLDFNISESVKIELLDEYCRENKIERIHLIKIDVEGHELSVLKGSVRMFEQDRIDMVMFEFGGANIDTSIFFKDFFDFFKKYDMVIYRITPSGYLSKLVKYNHSLEQFVDANYLALNQNPLF